MIFEFPAMSAKSASASFIRSNLDVSGGSKSDRAAGNREMNLTKTWLAMDAYPGMILRVLEPPLTNVSRTIERNTRNR